MSEKKRVDVLNLGVSSWVSQFGPFLVPYLETFRIIGDEGAKRGVSGHQQGTTSRIILMPPSYFRLGFSIEFMAGLKPLNFWQVFTLGKVLG
jgi:hypothetical protein